MMHVSQELFVIVFNTTNIFKKLILLIGNTYDITSPLRAETVAPYVQSTYNSPSSITSLSLEDKKIINDEGPCDIMEVKKKLYEGKYTLVVNFS